MDQEKIGRFIAELRRKKNMTQQELADELRVTDRAVSHWENGRRLPDISLLKELAAFFNVTIDEIISGKRMTEDEQKELLNDSIIEIYTSRRKITNTNRIINMCRHSNNNYFDFIYIKVIT